MLETLKHTFNFNNKVKTLVKINEEENEYENSYYNLNGIQNGNILTSINGIEIDDKKIAIDYFNKYTKFYENKLNKFIHPDENDLYIIFTLKNNDIEEQIDDNLKQEMTLFKKYMLYFDPDIVEKLNEFISNCITKGYNEVKEKDYNVNSILNELKF